MKGKRTDFYILCLIFITAGARAQDNHYGVRGFYSQTLSVTDSTPVTVNGLKAGYTIESESEKTVGKKGDFSRFKIKFWLANTGTEAKIMYRNIDFTGHSGPINNAIALFKCLNATGARFTNKMASMELQPCKLAAVVEDKECGTEKIVQNTRMVDIGYWIKPGETIFKTYPMIVPLGEKPTVTVTFSPEVANQTGTLVSSGNGQAIEQNYVRIKNLATGNYLHLQNGPLTCSGIDNNWWSAQWQMIPVAGGNNFQIKNRWKNNYISSSNSDMINDNGEQPNCLWMIQETATPNVFYIRNTTDNARLFIENGQLKTTASFIGNEAASKWVIEN